MSWDPIGVIVGPVAVLLIVGAVICMLFGIVLWCIKYARPLAPFITFIPTLALLGAVGGSWYSLDLFSSATTETRLAWWIIGHPIGGVLGGIIGTLLAIWFRSQPRTGDVL